MKCFMLNLWAAKIGQKPNVADAVKSLFLTCVISGPR